MTKYKIISITIGFLLLLGIFLNINTINRDFQPTITSSQNIDILSTSAESSYEVINDVFSDKDRFYESEGFFPQLYEPSLQATYYGLSILDILGKLGTFNSVEIIAYIMNYYDSNSGVFMDEYASRYLGTDFSHSYYPLSTLLEVNCYAILSLSLLGRLDLINIGKSVDFLWSCYNPVSSGFIGQPFDSNLEENFKISTMDNTYFAIITLDILMGSWSSYATQKDELIIYINSLQNTNPLGWKYGGFSNDDSGLFDSLGNLFEPNMLASYYCIKSLEVFDMVSTINDVTFFQFLDSLYDPVHNYFRMSMMDFNNFTNTVATAIGLELSKITNYPAMDKDEVLNFLYDNRNVKGLWDGSTSIHKYELIDTFQILRGIDNADEMDILNSFDDTQQIVESLLALFSSSEGFFLIPKEYNTIELTYTMVKSFDLFDRISELDLLSIYSSISDSYFYDDYFLYDGFMSYSSNDNSYVGFRTYPLEFYAAGDKNYINSIGYLLSHKATYQALDSLQRMYKLDDFALTTDLSRLLDNIIDTQFLNSFYPEQNGGFLPLMEYEPLRAEFLSTNIFLEYSFYAIKTMELIAEYLDIGDITFLDFDTNELLNYIQSNIVETVNITHYQPIYSNDIDIILENTYYMVYILKTLHMYNLNNDKIESFIEQNIDYTNMKNIYYCYKIIELLNLDIELSSVGIQDLITNIFDDSSHEFYATTARTSINQEIFLWICDMAKSNPISIIAQYDEVVLLGTYLTISASLTSLVLSEFDYNLSFQFESDQLGDNVMNKEDTNQFSLEMIIPHRTTNYPAVKGKIVAYDNTQKLVEKSISISTYYNQKYYKNEINTAVMLATLFLGVPTGFILVSTKKIKR